MRLNDERIKTLQILLKKLSGLDYTDEQAQEAGMAIMRFTAAKARREQELAKNKEGNDGQVSRTNGTVTQ